MNNHTLVWGESMKAIAARFNESDEIVIDSE